MRLPRRVPWTSVAELEQVCAWIYTDEPDLGTNTLAIDRLSAWRAITPLPHALESTLSLLTVVQQDRNTTGSSTNYLSLRHSYATAIVRLVNGLVDPLQLGAYARSIASIAAQLGFPAWLVELRHAATHEDIPSLEVLREAARQSMSWLLHRYFLPTINPSSAPTRQVPPLRPLEPILKQYKTVLKTIIRDASLRSRHKQEVNVIMRDTERWISEAKVAANIIVGELEWDPQVELSGGIQEGNRDDNIDLKEKWALDRFCDGLLEKGGLVPLSKKKRLFPEDKFWPPQLSISVWAPLLNHIQLLHADFAYTLCMRLLSLLLPIDKSANRRTRTSSSPVETTEDSSYSICLARWVVWSVDNWSKPSQALIDSRLKNDVVISLMQGLGRMMGDPRSNSAEVTRILLQGLCPQNPEYSAATELLSKSSNQFTSMEWTDKDMITMVNRLAQLVSSAAETETNAYHSPVIQPATMFFSSDIPSTHSDTIETEVDDYLPPGWRRLDRTDWKPCPIGVYHRP